MENTRLLKLLRSLSKQEQRDLAKYVGAALFNRRQEVIDLLTALEKPLRTGQPAPDKAVVFKQVFKNQPFDDHRIRMSMSFLYHAVCDFLTLQDFMQDNPQRYMRMAAVLRRRKLPTHFQQAYDAAAEAHEAKPLRNAAQLEEQYQIQLEKYRFDYEQPGNAAFNLQELSDRLDEAFIARKCWQACFMLSHQTISNTVYDQGLLDAALEQLKQRPQLLDIPAISIYYYCYRALTHPDEPEHFSNFKRILLGHGALFPPDELRDLYILAINFCIRQYNAGNQHFLAEQFELYKTGLDKQYFLSDGELSRYTFQNAATIGLVMNELDWVEQFIHQYRAYLPEQHRESVFSFNLARLEYRRRKLRDALFLLQKADYKDLLLNLAAKTLQMKIYFELDEFDLLESHLQAIKVFIRRKKVIGYHRENYLNTIYFTQKLLETNPYDKELRTTLHAEIEAAKPVAEKEWLLAMSNSPLK
jgi:hypothetical protein